MALKARTLKTGMTKVKTPAKPKPVVSNRERRRIEEQQRKFKEEQVKPRKKPVLKPEPLKKKETQVEPKAEPQVQEQESDKKSTGAKILDKLDNMEVRLKLIESEMDRILLFLQKTVPKIDVHDHVLDIIKDAVFDLKDKVSDISSDRTVDAALSENDTSDADIQKISAINSLTIINDKEPVELPPLKYRFKYIPRKLMTKNPKVLYGSFFRRYNNVLVNCGILEKPLHEVEVSLDTVQEHITLANRMAKMISARPQDNNRVKAEEWMMDLLQHATRYKVTVNNDLVTCELLEEFASSEEESEEPQEQPEVE